MSASKVPVLLPAEQLESIPYRLFGAAATARLLAREADSGSGDVSDALELLAHELGRLTIDLDVATWPSGPALDELREATKEALSEGARS